jgi:hypothetical protein
MATAFLVSLLLVSVFAGASAFFFFSRKGFGRSITTSQYASLGRIREIGELVALRIDCSEIGWSTHRSSLWTRGKSLLAKCDMILEYRFNLRNVVIRPTSRGVDLIMPEPDVTVTHGDVDVVHMQHGAVLGLPLFRLNVHDINSLLKEARSAITAKAKLGGPSLNERAEHYARLILTSYISPLAPAEKIRIMFQNQQGDEFLVGHELPLAGLPQCHTVTTCQP